MGALIAAATTLLAAALSPSTTAASDQCVDLSKDRAGCQPSTFDTPFAQTPSVRVHAQSHEHGRQDRR